MLRDLSRLDGHDFNGFRPRPRVDRLGPRPDQTLAGLEARGRVLYAEASGPEGLPKTRLGLRVGLRARSGRSAVAAAASFAMIRATLRASEAHAACVVWAAGGKQDIRDWMPDAMIRKPRPSPALGHGDGQAYRRRPSRPRQRACRAIVAPYPVLREPAAEFAR